MFFGVLWRSVALCLWREVLWRAVAFRLMYEEGFGVGRFHPGRSVVRVGASLAFAALIEPDEREAAREASVLATFVAFEKLELWGKLPGQHWVVLGVILRGDSLGL